MTIIGFTFSVVLTALLSSALTWMLGYVWFTRSRSLQTRLEQALKSVQDEFEQRVKRGVLAAGEELLPHLREQVRLGFQDALAKSQAAGLVENTASVVNLGADLVSGSLGALFGIKPKK